MLRSLAQQAHYPSAMQAFDILAYYQVRFSQAQEGAFHPWWHSRKEGTPQLMAAPVNRALVRRWLFPLRGPGKPPSSCPAEPRPATLSRGVNQS